MMKNIIRLERLFSAAKETLDHEKQIPSKIATLANMIKASKYPIFFTGAGCSTSINIPDYRSGQNTVVKTGPGVWNRTKQKYEYRNDHQKKVEEVLNASEPSPTHMAIKTLIQQDIFKHLVSQNTDGFHLRSGIPYDKISELHGNNNLQHCIKCKHKYLRDFRVLPPGVRTQEEKKKHATGRNCENCGGELHDSIVYFGEKLPQQSLARSYQEASKCDLCVCIGSSLTVKPALNVPILALQTASKLAIINIQQTPLDDHADIRINYFCDEVMIKLLQQLQIPMHPYCQEHYLQISMDQNNRRLIIAGKDANWDNFSFLKSATYLQNTVPAKGNIIQFEADDNLHMIELEIFLHRNKPSLYLSASDMYKLHHGEVVRLQIKRTTGKDWEIVHR